MPTLKERFTALGYPTNRAVAQLLGISAGSVSSAFNFKSPAIQVKMLEFLANHEPIAISTNLDAIEATQAELSEDFQAIAAESASIESDALDINNLATPKPITTEPATEKPTVYGTPVSRYYFIQIVSKALATTKKKAESVLREWYIDTTGAPCHRGKRLVSQVKYIDLLSTLKLSTKTSHFF